MTLHISNISVFDAASGALQKRDVSLTFASENKLDGSGLWLLPGLIDLCARSREPGATHKATMASESRAARACGITTFLIPPDTNPAIESVAVVDLIQGRVSAAAACRILPLASLTRGADDSLCDLGALQAAGCVAASTIGLPIRSSQLMRRALQYAASLDLTVFLQPVDALLSEDGCAHDGAVATRMGLVGIPQSAETLALARDLLLVEETGVRAHIAHLSCARSVEMIAAAKARGLPVTCDVAMHQLFLTELDVMGYRSAAHVIPPFRTQKDRDALREAVRDGVIDAVCSDHSPHDLDAKLAPFPLTQPGISALDTFLPLGLQLVEDGALSLARWLDACAFAPARILRLDAAQDWIIVDPNKHYIASAENFLSAGKNSPFMGWRLCGKVLHTSRD
jgi:dihydroorotase